MRRRRTKRSLIEAKLAEVRSGPQFGEDWGWTQEEQDLYDRLENVTYRSRYRPTARTRAQRREASPDRRRLRWLDRTNDPRYVGEAMKLIYSEFSMTMFPVLTPLLEVMKPAAASTPMRWGGRSVYFDVVTV